MTAVPFDTLKLADRRQAGGFTPEQARTAASALTKAMSGADLATKADLRNETGRIESAIELAKRDLTIRLGGMIAAGIAFLSFIKFFGH